MAIDFHPHILQVVIMVVNILFTPKIESLNRYDFTLNLKMKRSNETIVNDSSRTPYKNFVVIDKFEQISVQFLIAFHLISIFDQKPSEKNRLLRLQKLQDSGVCKMYQHRKIQFHSKRSTINSNAHVVVS